MECSITQMSNNRARLISRDKNSRPGIEKALISKSMKKDARLWTSFSFTLRRVRDSNPRYDVMRTPHFECGTFDHSVNSPRLH